MFLVVVLALPAGAAHAQTSAPAPANEAAGVVSYRPDFFAGSRPETALDMIGRIPGFGINSGASVRGYAGTAGNVLIDGERPVTKTEGITDVLARIPASVVERIDLIRGGAPGIDMQGRPVVVNVIRRKGGGLKRTAAAGAWVMGDGRVMPNLRYEMSRQTDPQRGWELVFDSSGVFTDAWGDARRIRRDAAGVVYEDIGVRIEGDGRASSARGSVKHPLWGGQLQVNASLTAENFKDEQDILLPRGTDFVVGQGDALTGEIGGNYAHSLGPRTRLELIALQRLSEDQGSSASLVGSTNSLFTEDSTAGESILRARAVHTRSPKLSLEGGGEVAFNFLDGRSAYLVNGAPRVVPSANVRVEELRGEVFAQAAWRPSETLSIEAGSRFETSTISQSGDVELEKSFFYAKPRVTMVWSRTPEQQLRLRFEREVGQLSFGDFIASGEFANDLIYAGNVDLEPQSSWVFEAVGEQRFWERGALTVTLRHREFENVLDLVPIVSGDDVFEAPGNIGDGRSNLINASLTAPLDRFGAKGALLRASGSYVWTEVTDPITGERRELSRQRPYDASMGITQDVDRLKLTWSADINTGWEERVYFVNQLWASELTWWWTTQVEYKPSPKWSLRLQYTDLDEYRRRRTVYSGLRGGSPVTYVEDRTIPPPFRINLRLRRTLGLRGLT